MKDAVYQWLAENHELAFAIVIYIIVNFAPRPHPDKLIGWRRIFWTIIDRVSILTTDKVPGRLKLIFAASPNQTEEEEEEHAD